MVLEVIGKRLSLPEKGGEPDPVVEDVSADAWKRVWRCGFVRDLDSHFYCDGKFVPLIEGNATFESARANVLTQVEFAIADFRMSQAEANRKMPEVELDEHAWESIESTTFQAADSLTWDWIEAILRKIGTDERHIEYMQFHCCEGLSTREIGALYDINYKVVWRAVQAMKAALKPHLGDS